MPCRKEIEAKEIETNQSMELAANIFKVHLKISLDFFLELL